MYNLLKQFAPRLISFTLLLLTPFITTAYEGDLAVKNKTLTINLVNANKKPQANIVVYVEPIGHIIDFKNKITLEIGQQHKSFTPYISVMQLGSSVNFNNQDNITHHIYSPVGENKFSVKVRSGQQVTKNSFNNAGEVSMGCNIHDWMSGYMLIVNTPYFSKTDKNGNAEISINTPGQYNVIVWHPQMNDADKKLTQSINLTQSMKVTMQLSKPMDTIPTQKSEDDFDFLSDY